MMVNQVKTIRKQMGWSQQQLADVVGVTRQTIILIEKGTYNPSLKLCLAICKALGQTLNDLFWIEKGQDSDAKN